MFELAADLQRILDIPELTQDRKNLLKTELTDLITQYLNTKFFISKDDDRSSSEESSQLELRITNGSSNQNGHRSPSPPNELSETEIVAQLCEGKTKHRDLEKKFPPEKAVHFRRRFIEVDGNVDLSRLPLRDYDYSLVNGACCENLIGYMTVPTGVAGPLIMDGEKLYIPMATTEGALIASTNRGCRALIDAGGVRTHLIDDAMTRAPVLQFSTVADATKFKTWFKDPKNYAQMKSAFEGTSRFCRLKNVDIDLEGNFMFLRFVAETGDAMGMNMVSKATQACLESISSDDHKFKLISLSGNQCVDKKSSAINWIKGRGKSVISEAIIPASVVKSILKTNVDVMVQLGNAKLFVGSSTGITIGGWNAHAANIVAALFLATGQDVAQVVSSSMCLTQLSKTDSGDLLVTCTMKCIEVGTVGGGTILSAQQSALNMLHCCGSNVDRPGENAKRLSRIICATVLAGELSLLASQCSNDLVRSHLRLNRSNRDFTGLFSITEGKVLSNGNNLEKVAKKLQQRIGCSSTF